MKTVLISGAAGFTGRYLASRLAAAGYEVHGTVQRHESAGIQDIARCHSVDLADPDGILQTIDAVAPDKVVHLAAISFVGHRNVNEIYQTNVVGTRNLLEALAQSRSSPSAVIIASSANVYGTASDGLLDESMPVAPVNDYGVTKAASELIARMYGERLPIIVARPFNYTGRGQSDQFVVPKIVSHARARKPVIELGNISVARDFSDVRSVVEAYARLLESPAAVGETFNICSGRATSLGELVEMIRRVSGHDLVVRTDPNLVRPTEVPKLWGSPSKLHATVGPIPMPPLEETLSWMLEE